MIIFAGEAVLRRFLCLRTIRLAAAALALCAGAGAPRGERAQTKPAESGPASAPSALAVGDRAPDFGVRDHAGALHKLAEYRGKRVVLWFYPKAATPG